MSTATINISNIAYLIAWVAYVATSVCAATFAGTRKDRWQRWALVLAIVGLSAHLVALGCIVAGLGRAPWGSLYEFISSMAAVLMIVTIILVLPNRNLAGIGSVLAGSAFALMGVGLIMYARPSELQPALQSNWLTFHVFLAITGSTLLLTGGIVSALYLHRKQWDSARRTDTEPTLDLTNPTGTEDGPARSITDHVDHTLPQGTTIVAERTTVKAASAFASMGVTSTAEPFTWAEVIKRNRWLYVGMGLVALCLTLVTGNLIVTLPLLAVVAATDIVLGRVSHRLPTTDKLDDLARRIITFAFPIWTLAIFAGAIWGEQAWSRYWGWDPKETTSFIVWGIFAAYLHARSTKDWKGTKAAILASVGSGAIIFNMFFVNLVISGLHSYAGV